MIDLIHWSNQCLRCKTQDYEPFGPMLWHYCVNCAQRCEKCGVAKPNFAFPYDFNSVAYKTYQEHWKRGGKGHFPQAAHKKICGICDKDALAKEKMYQEEKTRKVQEEIRDHPMGKFMLEALAKFKS